MTDPLTPLVTDGIIDEVVSRLKSGKEADIYLVRRAGAILVAKVYKDRHVRSFQNNAAYKEGRRVRNSRTQRAIQKGSRFGLDADEQAWKTKESEALHTLFAAGVRVPKPDLLYEGVLLMGLVVDAEGRPAPRLIDAEFSAEQAAEVYADLRHQVVTLLRCDLIHGDLSPYNVLMASNGPTLIDFPQVIGAAHNSQAERFFKRDLETLRQFFASRAPALNARAGDADEIWRAYVRRELTPGFVPRAVPVGQLEGRRQPRPPPAAPLQSAPRSSPAQRRKPVGQQPPSGHDRRGDLDRANLARRREPPARSPRPVVSYVGQPATAASPTTPATRRRRRRRRPRGGHRPPQA